MQGGRLGVAMTLAAAALAVAVPKATASPTTYAFSGSVSASGPRTQVKTFAVPAASSLDATLDWTTATADLNMVLRDPSGTVIASVASRTAKPEVIHVGSTGAATGTWRLAVSARAGAANFTLGVTLGSPITWDGHIRVWAAENEDARHDWTHDEAVAQATHFDAILSGSPPFEPISYAGNVADMKQANPSLLLVNHVNGTHLLEQDNRVNWPASSYLYDANGNKIEQPFWKTWLMNPLDNQWRSSRADECNADLQMTGYDTCYLDSLGSSGLTGNSAMPVNPQTGKQMTKQEWLSATTREAEDFHAAMAPKTVWGSGGANGVTYFGSPPESQLLAGLDATVHEGFCRRAGSSLGTFYAESAWTKDVEMVRDIEAHGKYALPLAKTFVNGTTDAKRAVMKYCLATFLLATNGASLFGFEFGQGDAMTYDPLWDTVLGAPTGPYATYAKVDGVYQRTFAHGRVLVNSTTTPATVGLGGAYTRPDGSTVTSLSMPPNTAEILTAS